MGSIANRASYFDKVHAVLAPIVPSGTRVALFDFPNHANVGDSAIWLGVEQYCHRSGLKVVHVDDCYAEDGSLPMLPDDVVVLINGGGNLGDLYPRHQRIRQLLLSFYKRNRIVQLPQSIQFDTEAKADECAGVFRAHPDFHLIVRDRESEIKARRLYSGPIYFCPDMALCLSELPAVAPTADIVALIRDDKEGRFRAEAAAASLIVCDWLDESPLLSRSVDWVTRRGRSRRSPAGPVRTRVYHRAAHARLRRGCHLLSAGRVVITDRLHAHILCTMLGVPHVVLDNSYGKISSFRNAWHTGSGGLCETATTIDEAVQIASGMLAMRTEATS